MTSIIHADKHDTTEPSDGVVVIDHGALKTRGGWFPAIRSLSKDWERMTYHALDKDLALEVAKREAVYNSQCHYRGDWTIVIRDHGEVTP